MKGKCFGGFSFVELLVVISIIVVLAAVGTVSYTSISKNSRDARRRADIESIRSALEICRTERGIYPDAIYTSGNVRCTGTPELITLNNTPKDPKTSNNYVYARGASPFTTYTLTCTLEGAGTCIYKQP